MASKATRKQAVVMGLVEGFADMLWDQHYRHKKNNKTFSDCRDKIKAAVDDGYMTLKKTGQPVTQKDAQKIKAAVIQVRDHMDTFYPMDAVSMLLDLLNDQLVVVGGEKRKVFVRLWYRVRELEHNFDRRKEWDDPRGYELARVLDSLEI